MSTQGGSLVCEASGNPTPDITVVFPSGLNKSIESGGRMAADAKGTVTINVTADAAGLYVCIAASPAGSTFATLSVEIPLQKPTTLTSEPTNSPITITRTSEEPESSSSGESTTGLSTPVVVGYVCGTSGEPESSNSEDSAPGLSMSALVWSVCGAVAGTAFIGAIIFVILSKRRTKNVPPHLSPSSVLKTRNDTVAVTTGHNQTALAVCQAISTSLIRNALYDRGATNTVPHDPNEDVDMSPTAHTVPDSSVVTTTNNTAASVATIYDKTALNEAQVMTKSFINPQMMLHV
ncbi:uncharacterized protein [Branchiostoma lanceolatum]|uniref:uncharacterized protein n=1 Tax=Branchiostoma lanceolatum TaxID=7740 RepID=UPI00345142A7